MGKKDSPTVRISSELMPREAIEFLQRLAFDDDFRSDLQRRPKATLRRFKINIPDELIPDDIVLPPKDDLRVAVESASMGDDLVMPAPVAAVFWVFLAFFAFFAFSRPRLTL